MYPSHSFVNSKKNWCVWESVWSGDFFERVLSALIANSGQRKTRYSEELLVCACSLQWVSRGLLFGGKPHSTHISTTEHPCKGGGVRVETVSESSCHGDSAVRSIAHLAVRCQSRANQSETSATRQIRPRPLASHSMPLVQDGRGENDRKHCGRMFREGGQKHGLDPFAKIINRIQFNINADDRRAGVSCWDFSPRN